MTDDMTTVRGHMAIWDRVRTPPATALKPIKGGRLAGKTDISPQWRFAVMTELFGPVGYGWTYTVDKLWTEPLADGQVAAFAMISLTINVPDLGWSRDIPGVGGNMLIEKESQGLHVNDECFKMAVTDALSVAMKALGVAADVYNGDMDGSKYQRAEVTHAAPVPQSAPAPSAIPPQSSGPVKDEQGDWPSQENRAALAQSYDLDGPGGLALKSGKHQGRTIIDIYVTEPGYIRWMAEKMNNEFMRGKARDFLAEMTGIVEHAQAHQDNHEPGPADLEQAAAQFRDIPEDDGIPF